MSNYLFNTKYLLAHKASNYPALFSPISKVMTGKDWFAGKHTDIVIDGFPRCANTYATFAFDIAQTKRLNIAHHIHKKSQFLVAAKYNTPAILLIRNPADCISSLLVRQPKYTPDALFKGYVFLYGGLLSLNSYVVADFENTLNDYASIIKIVNEKFGKDFNLYQKTEENEQKLKQIIHTQDELIGAEDSQQRVAYPDAERKQVSLKIKEELLSSKYKNLLDECNEIYTAITEQKTK